MSIENPEIFPRGEGDQKQEFKITQEILEICKGDEEAAKKVLEVRNEYINDWWNSEDASDKAWGQLHERILVMDFREFKRAVRDALDRQEEGVFTSEFYGEGAENLRKALKTKLEERGELDAKNELVKKKNKE